MGRVTWVKVDAGRAKAGEVSLYDVNGRLYLRWRHQGKLYSLAVGMGNYNAGVKTARQLAGRIESDMAHDRAGIGEPLFDPTLSKYSPRPKAALNDLAQESAPSTVELWDRFTGYRREGYKTGRGGFKRTSPQAIASKYLPLRANLKRFGKDITDETSAREFFKLIKGRQSPRTANQNLSLLLGFGRWAVESGHWESNHFDTVPPEEETEKPRRDAFTADEVRRFLAAIKIDKYFWRYHDFAYALFHLGCRPSELIGLRWGHVDLEGRKVVICESLSRGEDGQTAGYARQRRGTKTGNIRYLPLDDEMLTLLKGRRPVDATPDSLVFPAPRGGPIDDHLFSQRCWRSICEKAEIPYRSPYVARHTCLSHIVEATGSLAQAAAVAGHANLSMVSKTYGHLVTDIQLPRYGRM